MNTEDRKLIFATIMTANDFQDAFYKILKLKRNEKDVVRVLITCCG